MTKQLNKKREEYKKKLIQYNLSKESIDKIMKDQDSYDEDIKFVAYEIGLAPIMYPVEFGIVDED